MKFYPAGKDQILLGKCPKGATSAMACMFCTEGHVLECHAGMTCEEAECDHYQAQQLIDRNDPDKTVR